MRGTLPHLGMLSPVNISDYREFLDAGSWRDDLPRGQGGSPANLLCRELLARKQRLTIFTLDPAVTSELILEGEHLRICVGPYGMPPGRGPARDFFAVERRWLGEAIARERPDVLHAQWTYQYALAAQASGLPHVITAHDAPLNVLRHEFIPYRIAHTLMALRVISRAHHIVSVSPHVAAHLRRFMLYRGPSTVVPNGVPQALFDLARTGERPHRPVTYATILSSWGRLKNGQAALSAFGKVRELRPTDRLIMLGHGHGPGQPAELWARARGLDRGVEFRGHLGHQEVLRVLAQEVDVLVHPSLEESFGMTLVEAAAMGVPVIAGERSGAVPWTLEDGVAGVLVDVCSAGALARAMIELGASPEARASWGAKGRASVMRRFHVSGVADAYQDVYSRTIEARA